VTPCDRIDVNEPPRRADRYRTQLADAASQELRGGEQVVGMLPFATVPKRPKGPEGKIRDGIYQSQRRYRPLVVTDRRLLVFESGRTPFARALLADFPLGEVAMTDPEPGRMGIIHFTVSFPREGDVPFEVGRRDDVDALRAAVSD
jgi:hypothetical protein